MDKPDIMPADVLVLLKLAALDSYLWRLEFLSLELGHSTSDVMLSIRRLRLNGLLDEDDKINITKLKEFLLYDIQDLFPIRPGAIVQGMLTGAKPGNYFAIDLPYTSIWVWPDVHGREKGFEIKPLSPHCCFAAANDSKLKNLLAITETMRVAGTEARKWATVELGKVLITKKD